MFICKDSGYVKLKVQGPLALKKVEPIANQTCVLSTFILCFEIRYPSYFRSKTAKPRKGTRALFSVQTFSPSFFFYLVFHYLWTLRSGNCISVVIKSIFNLQRRIGKVEGIQSTKTWNLRSLLRKQYLCFTSQIDYCSLREMLRNPWLVTLSF